MGDVNMKSTINSLSDAYSANRLTRRSFVNRLLALGVSAPMIAALVAEIRPAEAAASNLKGNVRLFIGPYSPNEEQYQNKIAEGFRALHPDVTFEVRLYDWSSGSAQIATSVAQGAHDIYLISENEYPTWEAQEGFTDMSARVNDASFAEEKSKFLFLDRTSAMDRASSDFR